MKQLGFCFVSIWLFLIVLSMHANGQEYQTFRWDLEQMSENARWRLGPFLIYPSFQLRNIGYDNNIYGMSEENDPVADFTAAISPQATFYLPYRNLMILSFSINPEYVYYKNESHLRGFNLNYSPEFRIVLLDRFVASSSYQYQRARQRRTSEFDRLVYVESRTLNASLFLETSRMTTVGFTGRIRNSSFEDIEGEISYSTALNREERSGNFEFYYRVLSDSDFFLTVGYAEYEFESPESRWRNSYSYDVISGIRFPLSGWARGTLSLGYRSLVNREDEDNRFSGFIGDTGLDFRLGRFNLRVLFVRDFRFSYSSTNLYFTEDRFGSGISFYLTPSIRMDYDFSIGEGKYPEEEQIRLPDGGFEEIRRVDKYLSHSAGLVFRIMRNTGVGLTVTYWKRDSNIYDFRRSRAFIGGFLTYDF